ncbi:response regulator [uncultured Paludibaculum sp.]|uniref:response regulator n=1 Tax=uncultured Paludibaculum sp. TaxID=1765020 RepID=UPI002AAAECD0|nr:response regulator [uncultured Paludibaculum sp.]
MPKIVVIDDSPSTLEAVESMLAATGFEVSAFTMWASAVQKLTTEVVDLIITDVYMPGADGLEVIRARRHICPDVPVVAMSGMRGRRDMLKVARLMGACQTLRKPFSREELVAAVHAALNVRCPDRLR